MPLSTSCRKTIIAIVSLMALTSTPVSASIGVENGDNRSWNHQFENGISCFKKHLYNESEFYFLKCLNSSGHDLKRSLASLTALEELFEETQNYKAKELVLLSHLKIATAYRLPGKTLAEINQQLGDVYSTMEKYEKAKDNFYEALKQLTSTETKDDFTVASILNNLAYCEFRLKDLATAELHYKQALAIFTQLRGTSSVCFGLTAGNLADLYECSGRNQLALTYFERAIYSLSESIGRQHPLVKKFEHRRLILKQKLLNPFFDKRQNLPFPEKQFQLPKPQHDLAFRSDKNSPRAVTVTRRVDLS